MPGRTIEAGPDLAATTFLFHLCQVEQRGALLTVTVPSAGLRWRGASLSADGSASWTQPSPLAAADIGVRCAPGQPRRHDRSEYPKSPRFPQAATFRFSGAVDFGRLVSGGSVAFQVKGRVEGVDGLHAGISWSGFEAIELSGPSPSAAPTAGGAQMLAMALPATSGPHLPYP